MGLMGLKRWFVRKLNTGDFIFQKKTFPVCSSHEIEELISRYNFLMLYKMVCFFLFSGPKLCSQSGPDPIFFIYILLTSLRRNLESQ